ncbi:hypothetical protein [Acinetobacter pittii]|uniref:hypothetical protein n=1 Tax=Acinetobacter pittii TaxID=48296 RepID=UPI003A879D28
MSLMSQITPEENLQLLEAKIITKINEIKNQPELMSSQVYSLFLTLSNGYTEIHRYIHNKKSLYGNNINLLFPIYETILQKIEIIQNNDSKELKHLLDTATQEGHYYEFYVYDMLFSISYEKRKNLTNFEFDTIYQELISKNINLSDSFDKNLYSEVDNITREKISEAIIGLKNTIGDNLTNPNTPNNSHKNIYLETLSSINELKKLKSQVDEIKDSHEILTRIKENKAFENTYELNKGYIDEADKLYKDIKLLNRIIILLFTGIVAIITTKLALIFFLQEFFKDIYNFLTYLSLLVSASALITYLIKERSRLIKLHDFFNLTALKLSTLPQYMRELDSNQRQDLIINLSSGFFLGSDKLLIEPNQQQNNHNDNLTKIASDILKLVNDQKK